jgi:hypothetical protein
MEATMTQHPQVYPYKNPALPGADVCMDDGIVKIHDIPGGWYVRYEENGETVAYKEYVASDFLIPPSYIELANMILEEANNETH